MRAYRRLLIFGALTLIWMAATIIVAGRLAGGLRGFRDSGRRRIRTHVRDDRRRERAAAVATPELGTRIGPAAPRH